MMYSSSRRTTSEGLRSMPIASAGSDFFTSTVEKHAHGVVLLLPERRGLGWTSTWPASREARRIMARRTAEAPKV
jgi:hypothetical protein